MPNKLKNSILVVLIVIAIFSIMIGFEAYWEAFDTAHIFFGIGAAAIALSILISVGFWRFLFVVAKLAAFIYILKLAADAENIFVWYLAEILMGVFIFIDTIVLFKKPKQ